MAGGPAASARGAAPRVPPTTHVATPPIALALRALALVAWLPLVALAQGNAWESGSDALAPIPPLSARVTDVTNTLSAPEKQALEAKLAAFEQQTGGQFAVLMVPTTRGEPIEAYGIRVADAWKIGRKGQDNGVILLVAKDDRKLRLEVGYGYEGVLTDAMSKRVIAETITPFFRQGQFAAGINAGVDRVIGIIGKDPSAIAPPSRGPPARGAAPRIDFVSLLVLLLVVVPVIGGLLRRIFGKVGGATVGAGLVGTGAAVVAGSIVIGVLAAVIAWVVLLFLGAGAGLMAGGRGGRAGPWIGGGGWGGGGGFGGGGGWGGGGGGFGGGGASGGW